MPTDEYGRPIIYYIPNTKASKEQATIQDRCDNTKQALDKIVYFPQDNSTECPTNYTLETISRAPNEQGVFVTLSYCCALYDEE